MKFQKFIKGDSNNLEIISKDDYIKSVNFLIEDENEAISGYDKIILLVENGNRHDKKEILQKLNKIRKDELEHIEILKTIMKEIWSLH